jgi:flagellar biosynthesis GTPase FlhF
MRHKKSTIHKNKHNKTRKTPVRNRSKQASRKYKSQPRKTMKMRGGSDMLSKAYGAVQTAVFGDPDTPEPDPSSRPDIMTHMAQVIEFPMPTKKYTNPEYTRMIEFQRRFIDLIGGIKTSKIKSPYVSFSTLLQNIVDFNKQMPSYKHYDFLIGYYPSTSENHGLKIIDFSAGDNQLPRAIKLYVKSNQFDADYDVEVLVDESKGIEPDLFDRASYIAGIDNDAIYNYKPTLIGILDAIYYCIPDKIICLELTRQLHGVDPHIVERVSPLTWTTPLCTAVSFLKDKKVIVGLMELIKSNQMMQKSLFNYSEDSYYPTIDDDDFRENGIKILGDRFNSVKMFLLLSNVVGVGSNPDGSRNMNLILIRNNTKYIYEMLGKFWEKYKGYIIKYCVEWYEPGLPLTISQWLGYSMSDYIAEIKEQERLQNMSEVELLAQFEEDAPKATKGSKKAQPKQQPQAKKKPDKEVEDRKKAEADEKERVRFEQARLRAEAEERKRVAAEAEAERKRLADQAEAERKRIADEEKKVAKAAKKNQKKAEEALAATAAAEAEAQEARNREKQRLSARTPPFFELEPNYQTDNKYLKMEESSQGASQSIEMGDPVPFQSIAQPIPVGPKVAYPDLSGLKMLGVNPDYVIASTMGLLQPYIDSGNINGVCGLITSKITNYTLKNDMYYDFMSCVIFIILGQLTNLLKTTKYRLILKGSKALQVAFSNTIDTKSYLMSDDIDILLVPADREAIKRNPRMYEDSDMVAGDICSMIEWIINSTLPPGRISVLNPMKQRSRNPNVFKISHLETNGKLSVIADIDIRYSKNAYMAQSQEDMFLSQRNFPVMSEDQSFDVFYNPTRMIDTTIDIPNMQLVYLHQTIDVALEEKIYYYIKYILLKTPYNDNSFLLDKFKKSIIAILKYNYFMIPAKDRKKFIDYSKLYIITFLSRTPLNQFSTLVSQSLFT